MNFVAQGFVDNGYFIRDSDTQGKFRFDGLGRKIFVNGGVTSISMPDLYSRWIDWMVLEDNAKFKPAMRFSGYDPIPGGFTGTTFFLFNGWKLVYDANSVAVSGVLYSENYPTAYWSATGAPIFPATVSSLVNSAVSTQNVVTGTALTPEQTAEAVWGAATRTLTSLGMAPEQIAAAVMAQIMAGIVPANVKQMNGAAVVGDGTENNKWRGDV
jgi:hypothetical protein